MNKQLLNADLSNLWAKTSRTGDAGWHPLILHMVDVAATADAILEREPLFLSSFNSSDSYFSKSPSFPPPEPIHRGNPDGRC